MRRWLGIVSAVAVALVLLVVTAIATLIGLEAECTGSTLECPRSDTYRSGLIAIPLTAAGLLVVGAALSVR